MHIACIGNRLDAAGGGLDRYLHGLAAHLAEEGHDIHLFGLGDPRPPQERLHVHGLADPAGGLLARLATAYRCYGRHWPGRVDVVNLHFALYAWPGLGFLPPGVPRVFHFHGPWAEEGAWQGDRLLVVALKRRLEKLVYRRCDRFVTLSQYFRRVLHSGYGVPESAIHVIPGGIDTDHFVPTADRRGARRRLGWPEDRFVLFSPRRLVPRMGLEDLITAVGALREQYPDFWLAIAGRGPTEVALREQIARLGLKERVHLLGFVSDKDLVCAYQAADLTVVPSLALEGFGLVLAESLACGTPALATPVGGMPEVLAALDPDLIAGGTGEGALALALAEVRSGRRQIPDPRHCRAYACEHYAWPVVARRVLDVFRTHPCTIASTGVEAYR